MIAHAVKNGAKKLIVGLGGSATNDGGARGGSAWGAVLTGAGEAFVPVGKTLPKVRRIDTSACPPEPVGVEIRY